MLLILLGLMNLNVFSQIDTNNVILTKPVAKLIVKDLIKADGCQQEVLMLNQKVLLMDTLISQKDSVISILNMMGNNYKSIIELKDGQISLYDELTSNLKQNLKSQRRNKFFFQLSTIALSLSTLIILVK